MRSSFLYEASAYNNEDKLEQYVIQVPTVTTEVLGKEIKDIFSSMPEIEGIVVLDGSAPVGLIMRTAFYQKLGGMYGNALFMQRSVKILMATSMLIVDAEETVASIGDEAMRRSQSKLYDYVIVLKNRRFAGVISIRLFLIELTKKNEAQIDVLRQQQIKLVEANRQEKDLRDNLIIKSHTIKNLLDNAGQGFLLFGGDLIIREELSAECVKLFRSQIAGENYARLMEKYFPPANREVLGAALIEYFSNTSPVTDCVYLMLLPTETQIEGRDVHFEYKRIENGGEKSVMVILSDITEQQAMKRAVAQEQNTQQLIIKVLGSKDQIRQMLSEFYELFGNGYKDIFERQADKKTALTELFRAVHTYKGDFAQYGFVTASERLHGFEEKLGDFISGERLPEAADIDELMSGFEAEEIVRYELDTIANVLGSGWLEQAQSISVPQEVFAQLEQRIGQGPEALGKREILSMLLSLKRKNLKTYLNQYGDYLQYLAQRLMKSTPLYIVEGDDVYIDPDKYGQFLRSLVHIYRNIIDHGIEPDEERIIYGKQEQGVVICKTELLQDKAFKITISDDGKGIDTKKLRQKAISEGYIQPDEKLTEQEAVGLIFMDRLSTRESADMLSGRGVGMPAVKSACESMGGSLEVSSQAGLGTTFVITLPLQ